jgi:3-hydroxybutyryl-CoA dehydrogenase
MKLVEVVKTVATSDKTLATGKEFSKSLGKTVVIAPDIPGFIVNRLQIPFRLDAILMLEACIATRDDIDTTLTLGLGDPMCQLALQDIVGLDVTYAVANALYGETKDPRFALPSLMKKMVAADWLGRKTGKGFYDYSN